MKKLNKKINTTWQKSSKWYSKIVSDRGHYYHQKIVIPQVLDLMAVKKGQSVLDLACGQGVLSRHLPRGIKYVGIDNATALIREARYRERVEDRDFIIGDVTKNLPIEKYDFDFVTIILALQNIKYPQLAIIQAAKHLKNSGKLIIVLNHPCFRIPRQSSWEIDQAKKLEYRRIDKYMTEMEIPIMIHPGSEKSPLTWTFHYPLSSFVNWLKEADLLIGNLQEWISDKTSIGKAAKMENRSRLEFPLFLTIVANKI